MNHGKSAPGFVAVNAAGGNVRSGCMPISLRVKRIY